MGKDVISPSDVSREEYSLYLKHESAFCSKLPADFPASPSLGFLSLWVVSQTLRTYWVQARVHKETAYGDPFPGSRVSGWRHGPSPGDWQFLRIFTMTEHAVQALCVSRCVSLTRLSMATSRQIQRLTHPCWPWPLLAGRFRPAAQALRGP